MMDWIKSVFRRKPDIEEYEHEARIENAERDLAALRKRGDKALSTLQARHTRNHWTEAIEQMITGTSR